MSQKPALRSGAREVALAARAGPFERPGEPSDPFAAARIRMVAEQIEARERFRRLVYEEIHLRPGDGYRGWPEAAPFDAIIAPAAAPRVPAPLLDQLRPGGRLVLPMGHGDTDQQLYLYEKTADGTIRTRIAPTYFVPMTGEVRR
jgi:protein-L-isoaspartate(D-aspartate) O-methyltransferase